MSMLTGAQQDAIDFVRQTAARRLDQGLLVQGLSGEAHQSLRDHFANRAQIGLHFHPDRVGVGGRTVVQSLLQSGVYKSQFETLLSNGSLSAVAGGERDEWERRLFGGAYQREDVRPEHRPTYGALDLWRFADGPAPRFGSCYFLTKPHVLQRSTFCYGDSHLGPDAVGVLGAMDEVLSALIREAGKGEVGLGQSLQAEELLEWLTIPLQRKALGRLLDHYIEAQIHGRLSLLDDIDSLYVDPSFKKTETGEQLQALAERFHITLTWHPGFVLDVAKVPDDFRGPSMPPLARHVAPDGRLNAAKIGVAARLADADGLQELKRLWHVLVRFGDVA